MTAYKDGEDANRVRVWDYKGKEKKWSVSKLLPQGLVSLEVK